MRILRSTAFLALFLFSLSESSLKADELNAFGSANNFAVLGASAVTNTGATVLNGNLGLYPGTSITGFPPGTVNGTTYDNGGVVQTAQADALNGYNTLLSLSSMENLTGKDLGGLTLMHGVYTFQSSADLTGVLVLNFEGLDNESIVFQVGSALTTASGSVVDILNEGTNDSVYWEVGSSATLGTTSAFEGILAADQSITLDTGATIACGDALALNGAVTMDTNTIGGGCSPGGGSETPSLVPEPGTFGLLATGILGAAGAIRRRLSV